ncbi:MAG: glycosyltransferase [Dehalococcoidia bacterium]|nr:MAG: glycosyltransferase [Dehalococcoidia bacterium]
MNKPLVSVIIPTFNSERFLEMCLHSIKEQTYPNIEITVVDSYSSDGTKEIAEKFGAKVIESKVGRSEARNIGAKKVRGELILSLDSDMELTPRVFEECVKKVKEGYDAIIIPEVSVGVGFWAKCKALEKSCYIGDDLIEASRFFKREAFEAVKGYDPELEFGEDWDLNQRIRNAGYKIGRIDTLINHHEGRLNLWKNMKKKYQYGKTLEKYQRKHPNEAKQQFRFIRLSFVKNWRKLTRDPIHALGMLFMKTCEFLAWSLGALSQR